MRRIRPLSSNDLPAVVSLFERIHRSGSSTPPPGLSDYFARTFLDHPWADSEIPSLVFDEGGQIRGFIASTVRRLRFDGQPIRLACSGPFFVDPDLPSKSVGPFLLRRYMQGPQDITITDSASDTVRRMWESFGGECLHLSSIRWVRLFRPVQCVTDEFLLRTRRTRLRSVAQPVVRVMDSVLTRLPFTPFRNGAPNATAEPLTPDLLIEQLRAIDGSLRVYPDYDRSFLNWLFDELGKVETKGRPCAMLVRDPTGPVLGWYVCLISSQGLSQVLQVAGTDDKHIDLVLDHLFAHAREAGARGLIGRLEPRLLVPLANRGCSLHNRGQGFAMMHSKNPDLSAAVRSGRALLTRLEGETWFGHLSEPFTRPTDITSGGHAWH